MSFKRLKAIMEAEQLGLGLKLLHDVELRLIGAEESLERVRQGNDKLQATVEELKAENTKLRDELAYWCGKTE